MSMRVKQIVSECLSSLESYKNNNKRYRALVAESKSGMAKIIIDTAEYCLKEKTLDPLIKLNAMRLLKEVVDTKNFELVALLQANKKIIEAMYQIALFDKDNKDDDRGATLFAAKNQVIDQNLKAIGNSMLRICLECFMYWSIMFESDLTGTEKESIFKKKYRELLEQRVKFPVKINYFKVYQKELEEKEKLKANVGESLKNTVAPGAGLKIAAAPVRQEEFGKRPMIHSSGEPNAAGERKMVWSSTENEVQQASVQKGEGAQKVAASLSKKQEQAVKPEILVSMIENFLLNTNNIFDGIGEAISGARDEQEFVRSSIKQLVVRLIDEREKVKNLYKQLEIVNPINKLYVRNEIDSAKKDIDLFLQDYSQLIEQQLEFQKFKDIWRRRGSQSQFSSSVKTDDKALESGLRGQKPFAQTQIQQLSQSQKVSYRQRSESDLRVEDLSVRNEQEDLDSPRKHQLLQEVPVQVQPLVATFFNANIAPIAQQQVQQEPEHQLSPLQNQKQPKNQPSFASSMKKSPLSDSLLLATNTVVKNQPDSVSNSQVNQIPQNANSVRQKNGTEAQNDIGNSYSQNVQQNIKTAKEVEKKNFSVKATQIETETRNRESQTTESYNAEETANLKRDLRRMGEQLDLLRLEYESTQNDLTIKCSQLDQSKNQLNGLRAQSEQLQNEITIKWQSEFERLASESSKAQTELSTRWQAECEQLRTEKKLLQDEVALRIEQLTIQQQNSELTNREKITHLEELNTRLYAELVQWRRIAEERQQEAAQIAEALKLVQQSEKSAVQQFTEMADKHRIESSKLEEKTKELQVQNQQLQKKLEESQLSDKQTYGSNKKQNEINPRTPTAVKYFSRQDEKLKISPGEAALQVQQNTTDELQVSPSLNVPLSVSIVSPDERIQQVEKKVVNLEQQLIEIQRQNEEERSRLLTFVIDDDGQNAFQQSDDGQSACLSKDEQPTPRNQQRAKNLFTGNNPTAAVVAKSISPEKGATKSTIATRPHSNLVIGVSEGGGVPPWVQPQQKTPIGRFTRSQQFSSTPTAVSTIAGNEQRLASQSQNSFQRTRVRSSETHKRNGTVALAPASAENSLIHALPPEEVNTSQQYSRTPTSHHSTGNGSYYRFNPIRMSDLLVSQAGEEAPRPRSQGRKIPLSRHTQMPDSSSSAALANDERALSTSQDYAYHHHSRQGSSGSNDDKAFRRGQQKKVEGLQSIEVDRRERDFASIEFEETIDYSQSRSGGASAGTLPSQHTNNTDAQNFYSQLIYPFKRPDDYYNIISKNKQSRTRGRPVIFQPSLFENIAVANAQDFLRLRKCCLLDKGIIFENTMLRVGCQYSTQIFHSRLYLKLVLHFYNVAAQDIESFCVEYGSGDDLLMWTKPAKLRTRIDIARKVKQEVIIDPSRVPFGFAQIQSTVKLEGQNQLQNTAICLPATFNRYLKVCLTTAHLFRQQWKLVKANAICTQEFAYDRKILKSIAHIQKYFENLTELREGMAQDFLTGVGDFKLGCAFTFYLSDAEQYLLKVCFKPGFSVQLMAASCRTGAPSHATRIQLEFLLQTYYFLLRKY